MAKQTFKVNVDLDSKSLSKLKKTLADARVKVDEKSISSLEDSMASLEAELDRNSEHLNVLTDAIANIGGGSGGRPSDLMGGSGAVGGGSAGVLGEIRDLLEANGTRLKSLSETTEAGFNEEAHKRLKQMSISQLMLDDQLKTKRIWLRAIIGGGGGSGVMRALQAGGGALFGNLMEKAQDVFKYQTAKESGKLNMAEPTFGSQTEEQKKEQAGGIQGKFEDVSKRAEGRMGKMLGKLGGGKGMKAAGAIGLGALGLASLAKKGFQALVEASPMLKQMMKMLNFGVMMILRPIGDFFGFFLRPIFVYLLRKFIIPFYQTYLPLMQQLGTDIGETVVAWLEVIGKALDWFSGVDKQKAGEGIIQNETVQADQLRLLEEGVKDGKTQMQIADDQYHSILTGGGLTDPEPNLDKYGNELPDLVNTNNTKLDDVIASETSLADALEAASHQPTIGTQVGADVFGYGGNFEGGSLNYGAVQSATTGSQFQSYYQQQAPSVNIEVNVEGSIDKEFPTEETMKEIADEVVKKTYNLGNRKGR